MPKPIRLLIFAALAFSAAACASSSSTASTLPTNAVAPATAAGQASQAALASGPLASLALPSFDIHAAPALEATLPDSVNGQSLTKVSLTLAQLSALNQGTPDTNQAFNNWVQSLGKNPSDVLVAAGVTTGSPEVTVVGMQVSGADQSQMLSKFQQSLQQASITSTQTQVGGKQVLQLNDPNHTDMTSYAYSKNDVLYFAQSTDASAASSAIQALP